ncbi:MAG: HU family DNA-binding protein [Bacteroidaceae bacterium]|jgi:nucleoid DNA-binding protein/nucleoid-associated protein YgaU
MNEKISTAELADLLAKHASISPKSAADFIRAAFPLIGKILQEKKYLKINGLGTFKLITVSSRESVDINTGKRILIDSYNKITFTPDTILKEKVNKPFQHFETVELRDDVDFSAIDEEMEDTLSEDTAAPAEEETVLPDYPRAASEEAKDFSEKEEGFSEKAPEEMQETLAANEEAVPTPVDSQSDAAEEAPAENTEPAMSSEPQQAQETIASQSEKTPEPQSAQQTHSQPSADAERQKRETAAAMSALAMKTKEEYEKEDPTKRFSLVISVKHCFVLSLLIIAFLIYICVWKPAWLFECDWPMAEPVIVETSQVEPVPTTPPAAKPKTAQPEQTAPPVEQPKVVKEEKVWITTRHANPRDYKIVGVLDSVTIAPGNSLTKFSKKYYGSMDLWPLIAEYNEKLLQNPDNLPIGATILIPRLAKR